MFNRYGLIRFRDYWQAEDYCKRLPDYAKARVEPVMWGNLWMFSVTVSRDYAEGRI